MAQSFEECKAFLKSGSEGTVVYEHLTKIIGRIIADRPNDPYSAFEILSRAVKTSDAAEKVGIGEDVMDKRAQWGKDAFNLTKIPGGEDGEGASGPACWVPNYMEEAELFEWAGVGFGNVESYQLMMSLRKLALQEQPNGLVKLRLWGKILGKDNDYYVAEGQLNTAGEADENDPAFEPQGTGANKYTYWVTNTPTSEWSQLDDVKPAWIIAARQIRRIFTGDLSAKVISHPPFPGDEKALLRAQIARISADTVLCVNGYLFNKSEDEGAEPEIEEDPAFIYPPAASLAKLESWTHCTDHILKIGRCSYQEPAAEGDDAEEQLKALNRIKAADPPRSLIRGAWEDRELQWAIRQCGDMATYQTSKGVVSSCCTAVRSLTWPGAFCVTRAGSFANVYVGHALKVGEQSFFPPTNPDVMDEPPEITPTEANMLVPGGEMIEPQGEEPAPVEAEGEEGG